MSKCPYCGEAVKPTDSQCSYCFYDLRGQGQAAAASPPPMRTMQTPAAEEPITAEPVSTRRDVAEEVYQPAEEDDSFNVDAPARDSAEFAPQAGDTQPFRPRLRPPLAVVKILDDDGKDGESVRVRTKSTIFGRAEGEIVIPHERMMSGKHAELSRRFEEGQYCWYLKDLESTNGTYVKVKNGRLQHNSEIMIGAFRYRFDAAPQGAPEEEAEEAEAPTRTLGWKRVSPDDLTRHLPSLIRITPEGEADRYTLPARDQCIGADAGSCEVAITDDTMLSHVHVRLFCDEHNRWHLEDAGSLNGTWLSISELRIEMSTQFQLGEQRFSIRFP